MHKKLAADLTSLAHSILQMKNKEDVFALKSKANELYEKLSVLAYVEEYINTTPNTNHTKESLLMLIEEADKKKNSNTIEQKIVDTVIEETSEIEENQEKSSENELKSDVTSTNEELTEEEIDSKEEIQLDENAGIDGIDLFSDTEEKDLSDDDQPTDNTTTLEEELKDTIAADVVADLFENAPKKSLNDQLQGDIQIGLNDRIAFVKNLFGGSQEDFNRVISQLNSFKTQKEATKFINKMVKPDYDWTDKEEIEERFLSIVDRKFT